MEWMLDIQLGRRNLSPIQRIAVAEKYRPIYEKQARENQLSGLKQNQNTVSQNSSKRTEPIDVCAKLAETAGVSTDTYSKGKKFLILIIKMQSNEFWQFSKAERIESLKAKERMSDGDKGSGNISTTVGKTRDVVASKVGIGSGKQYEKEKYYSS